MHSTHLRKEHIHGALLGVAIGESIGMPRTGLARRTALARYRRRIDYGWLPGANTYGDHTRLMLINAQALLNSRSEFSFFKKAFHRRFGSYLLSIPVGAKKSTLQASLRTWMAPFKLSSGVDQADAGAATRAMFCTLAINGCGHRTLHWVEESTKFTHTNAQAIDSCRLLSSLVDSGVSTNSCEFDPQAALSRAATVCADSELQSALAQLEIPLKKRLSARSVARRLGWPDHIQGLVPITTMAAYCWLRYRQDFSRVLRAAVTLGGDTATLGAIAGGLAGAHLGQAAIPDELKNRLGGAPHGPKWMDELAARFSHWPHGVDDLHHPRAQVSDPLLQIVRNVWQIPARSAYAARRLMLSGSQ